jgi:hypothetical protein
MEFKPFYFEGNLMWGHMNTPNDVNALLEVYHYEELRRAQLYPASRNFEKPSFGFYAEYNDKYTLGDWIDDNHLEEFFT